MNVYQCKHLYKIFLCQIVKFTNRLSVIRFVSCLIIWYSFTALSRKAEGSLAYSVIVSYFKTCTDIMTFSLRDILYFYVEKKKSFLRDSCYSVAKFAWKSQSKILRIFICAMDLVILGRGVLYYLFMITSFIKMVSGGF